MDISQLFTNLQIFFYVNWNCDERHIFFVKIGSLGSRPSSAYSAPSFARLSAIPFPSWPVGPGWFLLVRTKIKVGTNLFFTIFTFSLESEVNFTMDPVIILREEDDIVCSIQVNQVTLYQNLNLEEVNLYLLYEFSGVGRAGYLLLLDFWISGIRLYENRISGIRQIRRWFDFF